MKINVEQESVTEHIDVAACEIGMHILDLETIYADYQSTPDSPVCSAEYKILGCKFCDYWQPLEED